MNNLLFRVAELEEKLTALTTSHNDLEQRIGQAQLKTLEVFKLYPIHNSHQSMIVLARLNQVFKGIE